MTTDYPHHLVVVSTTPERITPAIRGAVKEYIRQRFRVLVVSDGAEMGVGERSEKITTLANAIFYMEPMERFDAYQVVVILSKDKEAAETVHKYFSRKGTKADVIIRTVGVEAF